MHRVQRVPSNEKSGRRHSSTVTVSDVVQQTTQITIHPSDVRCDTYRSSGNGGQHRNKTDSAVRLTHLPTGTVVTATEDRSQQVNRKVAWERLQIRLESLAASHDHSVSNETRQAPMGSGASYTWTQWRDEVKTSGRKMSMVKALDGKLDRLL